MTNRTRGLIPLPDGDVPAGTQCIMLCIPAGEQYKRQLMGGLYEFTHWNAYERDATHKATQVAQAWRNAILEGMLNCYQFRTNGGKSEYSTDGGATWTPTPDVIDPGHTFDPRNDEPLLPERGGSNIPCLAAANATACYVELHREVVEWYNNVGVAVVLLGALALALGIFFPVSWAVTGLAISSTGLAIIFLAHTASLNIAAFTTTIQQQLTCILTCRADAAGRWDADAYAGVLADIADKTGDMWRLIEHYISDVSGIQGLNNAGTTTSVASYDCSACVCNFCYLFDSTSGLDTWNIAEGAGVYSGGMWVHTDVVYGGGARRSILITIDFSAVTLTDVIIHFDLTKGTYNGSTSGLYLWRENSNLLASWSNTVLNSGNNQVKAWNGSQSCSRLVIQLASSYDPSAPYVYDGLCHILGIEIRGNGDNPWGEDNCV